MSTALEVQAKEVLSTDIISTGSRAATEIDSFARRRLSSEERRSLADYGGILRRAVDEIERQRTAITKPINDSLRTINALFGKHRDPIEKGLAQARAIESAQRTQDEREERERIAREQAAAGEAAAKASASEGISIPAAVIGEAPAQNVTRGNVGASVGSRVLAVELVDVQALAAAYPALVTWTGPNAARTVLRGLLEADPAATLPGVWHNYKTDVAFR